MAIGDIGMFTPAEAHYKRPGAYEEMLKAEALKRAAWLSSMDQFYANLAEAKRQFDLTLEFKTETRDIEMEQRVAEFGATMELEREKLDWEKEYGARALGVERERIAAGRGPSVEEIGELMQEKGQQEIDYLRTLLGGGGGRVTIGTPGISPPEGPGVTKPQTRYETGEVGFYYGQSPEERAGKLSGLTMREPPTGFGRAY